MKYYINNKEVNYTIFKHYLKKSIIYQCNFTLKKEEVNDIYISYYDDIKLNNVEVTFKDKMSYKIKKGR